MTTPGRGPSLAGGNPGRRTRSSTVLKESSGSVGKVTLRAEGVTKSPRWALHAGSLDKFLDSVEYYLRVASHGGAKLVVMRSRRVEHRVNEVGDCAALTVNPHVSFLLGRKLLRVVSEAQTAQFLRDVGPDVHSQTASAVGITDVPPSQESLRRQPYPLSQGYPQEIRASLLLLSRPFLTRRIMLRINLCQALITDVLWRPATRKAQYHRAELLPIRRQARVEPLHRGRPGAGMGVDNRHPFH